MFMGGKCFRHPPESVCLNLHSMDFQGLHPGTIQHLRIGILLSKPKLEALVLVKRLIFSALVFLVGLYITACGGSSSKSGGGGSQNPALTISAVTLPVGYVGSGYTSTTLTASGGSGSGYTWSVSSGTSLPAGVNLS